MPELAPIRHGRMLVSPFTFHRGAALIMAADLAGIPASGLRAPLRKSATRRLPFHNPALDRARASSPCERSVVQTVAWNLADRLGWADTLDAEYVALTQLQPTL